MQAKFQMMLMAEQTRLSNEPLASLGLDEAVEKGDEFARDRALLGLLKDEKVNVAIQLLDGMEKALESFVKEEIDGRSLDTLKTDFL